MSDNQMLGKWSYRSFLRNPDLSIEFNDLRFGAGTLELGLDSSGDLAGALGGTGWSLTLFGAYSFGSPNQARFQGKGMIGDEEWIYDYHGFLTPKWPNGVDERPSIVGTIVRTIPHSQGQAAAGLVASWIAVKQDQ